ncbi:MAG: META domain-containing protein [Halieaceae bacterium]
MQTIRNLTLATLCLFLVQACSEKPIPEPELSTIEGKVVVLHPASVPQGSSIIVSLEEVSQELPEPRVLASTQMGVAADEPSDFEILYADSAVREGGDYRLQAVVRSDDKVLSNSATLDDPFTQEAIELELRPLREKIASVPGKTMSLQGIAWHLASLGGEPVELEALEHTPIIQVDRSEPKFSGFSGCNNYNGGYVLNGTSLTLGEIASTRMACPDNSELETRYLAMLAQVRTWRMEDGNMVLGDKDRQELARFDLGSTFTW